MHNLIRWTPFLSLGLIFCACVNPVGSSSGADSSPGKAQLGVCAKADFQTQFHLTCTGSGPSPGLQSLTAAFAIQNPALNATNSAGEEAKMTASVAGEVTIAPSGGQSQTENYAGTFQQATYTAHGSNLDLTLTSVSGAGLVIDVELYYAIPANVVWKGTSYTMTCTTDSALPTATGASGSCAPSFPGTAKVVCKNPSTGLAPTDIASIESWVSLNDESVDYFTQGASVWDLSTRTFGSTTATQANGEQTTYAVNGGTLLSTLNSDGTATFSWDAALNASDTMTVEKADASGNVATQITLLGRKLIMPCSLQFD